MTVLNLTYLDQTVPILLVRRRMRSLRVVVKPGGQVILSAPVWASQEAIQGFLHDRAKWICEKYKKHSKQRSYLSIPWIEEGKANLWGKQLPVFIEINKKEGVTWHEDVVRIALKENTAERLQKVYQKALVALATEVFSSMIESRMPLFRARGCTRPTLKIKTLRSKWGSYHAGKNEVTMNLHLLKADRECAEYVLVHELTHMLYLGHGKEFHAFLNMVFPSARECKRRLDAGAED